MNEDTLRAFVDATRDQLIRIYKATVVTWDAWATNGPNNKSREILPLKLLYIRCDQSGTGKLEDSIVIDLFHQSDLHEIFWGCFIGKFGKNELSGYSTRLNDEITKYRCNACNEMIKGIHYSCEICDFDICSKQECQTVKHEHPMIELDRYFGINSFAKEWIVAEIIVPIN